MSKIIIQGKRGVGKSTLIRLLLSEYKLENIYGFYTKKEAPADDGLCRVYIHDAHSNNRFYTDENFIGKCKNCHGMANPSAFDKLGVHLLEDIPQNAIVVMDELGFFENDARLFQSKVLEILSSGRTVFAAMKDKETDFLNTLRSTEKNNIYNITEDNRDELAQRLISKIKDNHNN
ncbi:MAG: nucleoside-triphosphatase [Acutalibacteraceae bacterium]